MNKNIKTKISVMALAAVMSFSTVAATLAGCDNQASEALKDPQTSQTVGSLNGGVSDDKYSETTSAADRSNIFRQNYNPDVVVVNDQSGNE